MAIRASWANGSDTQTGRSPPKPLLSLATCPTFLARWWSDSFHEGTRGTAKPAGDLQSNVRHVKGQQAC